MAHGYEYGNARLRARHAALLGRGDLDRLLERDADGQLSVLAHTAWRDAVEQASTRFSGLRGVQEAARRHLADALRAVRPLYDEDARLQVDALLAVWDRRNLLTVLRAAERQRPVDEVLASIVPVGSLGEGRLRDLAKAGDPKAVIDRLVMWGEPVGRALLRVWPTFLERRDLAVLEQAVVGWYARAFEARRLDLEPLVADAITLDLARDEVLLAVRLRAARESGEELVASAEWITAQDLPGGRLRGQDLWDVVRAPSRPEAARVLYTRPGLSGWEVPLKSWASNGDIEALADALDRDVHRRRAAARYRTDPLGPGPIVAYVDALDVEARNVRIAAAGRAAGLRAEEIRPRLWED